MHYPAYPVLSCIIRHILNYPAYPELSCISCIILHSLAYLAISDFRKIADNANNALLRIYVSSSYLFLWVYTLLTAVATTPPHLAKDRAKKALYEAIGTMMSMVHGNHSAHQGPAPPVSVCGSRRMGR